MKGAFKVFSGMLTLREYTVQDLVRYSGVEASTVRSILQRNPSFYHIIGKQQTNNRGGRMIIYATDDQQANVLRDKIDTIYKEIRQFSTIADKQKVNEDIYQEIALSLRIVEDAILHLYREAKDKDRKTELLKTAEIDIQSCKAKISLVQERTNDLDRNINNVKVRLSILGHLKRSLEIYLQTDSEMSSTEDVAEPAWDIVESLYKVISGDFGGENIKTAFSHLDWLIKWVSPTRISNYNILVCDGIADEQKDMLQETNLTSRITNVLRNHSVNIEQIKAPDKPESTVATQLKRENSSYHLCILTIDSKSDASEAEYKFHTTTDIWGAPPTLLVLDAGDNPQLNSTALSTPYYKGYAELLADGALLDIVDERIMLASLFGKRSQPNRRIRQQSVAAG